MTGDAALEWLIAGNRRYISARLRHPHQAPGYRLALNEGQKPFAMILGCADSRVPPEVVGACYHLDSGEMELTA